MSSAATDLSGHGGHGGSGGFGAAASGEASAARRPLRGRAATLARLTRGATLAFCVGLAAALCLSSVALAASWSPWTTVWPGTPACPIDGANDNHVNTWWSEIGGIAAPEVSQTIAVCPFEGSTYAVSAVSGNSSQAPAIVASPMTWNKDFSNIPKLGAPTSMLTAGSYAVFLGACAMSGAEQNIYVFYLKSGSSDLYYRMQSNSSGNAFATEYDVQGFGAVSGAMQRKAGYIGEVVAIPGGFAFVFVNSAGQVQVETGGWTTHPTPSSASPKNPQPLSPTVWTYASTSSQVVNDASGQPYSGVTSCDACFVAESDNALLAVGLIAAKAGHVALFNLNPSSTTLSASVEDLHAPPSYGDGAIPSSIQVVQGGIDGGPVGDCVTALVRATVGTTTTGITGPELHILAYPVQLDSPAHDSAIKGSAPEYSGSCTYAHEGWLYTSWAPSSLLAFSVSSPSSEDPVTQTGWAAQSHRQYIMWLANTSGEENEAPVGSISTMGSLPSDLLLPVRSSTSDIYGSPLPDPPGSITWPVTNFNFSNSPNGGGYATDPSSFDPLGVVFGSPPFPLNGNDPTTYSASSHGITSITFAKTSTTGTSSQTTKNTNTTLGPTLYPGMIQIGGSYSFGTSSSTQNEATESETLTQTYSPEADSYNDGYIIYSQQNYESQLFQRYDWTAASGANTNNIISNSTALLSYPSPTGQPTTGSVAFNLTDPGQPDWTYHWSSPQFSSITQGLPSHPATDAVTGATNDPWGSNDPGILCVDSQGVQHGEITNRATLNAIYGNGGSQQFAWSQTETGSTSTSSTHGWDILPVIFESSCNTTSTQTHTLSSIANISASLTLPLDPSGTPGAADCSMVTVEVDFLRALDSQAYWIPDLYRTGTQPGAPLCNTLPWCIDYTVTQVAMCDSSSAARQPSCSVRVDARPVTGGTASILTSGGADLGRQATVGAGTTTILAKPADGYRFVRWRTFGGAHAQVKIASPGKARTTIRVTNGGLETVRAEFAPIVPDKLRVKLLRGDRCNLTLSGAHLPRWLTNASELKRNGLALALADARYVIPADALSRHGTTYTATRLSKRLRERLSGYRLSLDLRHASWSLTLRGLRSASTLLNSCPGGALQLGLARGHEGAATPALAVGGRATWRPAALSGYGKSAGASNPLSLASAVASISAPAGSSKLRFALKGATLGQARFDARGMRLQLNEHPSFAVGPFKRVGGEWVFKGTEPSGISVICRYTSTGRLNLKLGGPSLASVLPALVGQNLRLRVLSRGQVATANMITRMTSLSGVELVRRSATN